MYKNIYFMRWKMAASYKKLFKLLIDREMKSKDLAAKAGVSTVTLAKMKKDGATVSSDVLVKICRALNCDIGDIMEMIPQEGNE
jgi:DNA-binding Xre family transcriptional regulator